MADDGTGLRIPRAARGRCSGGLARAAEVCDDIYLADGDAMITFLFHMTLKAQCDNDMDHFERTHVVRWEVLE